MDEPIFDIQHLSELTDETIIMKSVGYGIGTSIFALAVWGAIKLMTSKEDSENSKIKQHSGTKL